jgi:hypothetical protein
MAQLQSTNVTGVLCVNGVAVGGGKDFKFCCFTSSTTFTPSSDLVDGNGFVEAHLIGGGGGGGAGGGWRQALLSSCFSVCGDEGAAGSFINSLVTIDSTDACTVTVGAKGDFGWVSGSFSNYCVASQVASQNTSRQKGSDGGNTTFGGFTSYGGCGGSSVVCAFAACCTQFTTAYPEVSNIDQGVLTQAGAYGGFRNSFETPDGGTLPTEGSGSEACLNNGKGEISKIGVQGADLFKRCSTGPNCSADSNCTVNFGTLSSFANCRANGAKYSQTYGNGGAAGFIQGCNSSGCTDKCTNSNGLTISGSDGDAGIVVIKWQE